MLCSEWKHPAWENTTMIHPCIKALLGANVTKYTWLTYLLASHMFKVTSLNVTRESLKQRIFIQVADCVVNAITKHWTYLIFNQQIILNNLFESSSFNLHASWYAHQESSISHNWLSNYQIVEVKAFLIYLDYTNINDTQRFSCSNVIGEGGLYCEYWQICNNFNSVLQCTYMSQTSWVSGYCLFCSINIACDSVIELREQLDTVTWIHQHHSYKLVLV